MKEDKEFGAFWQLIHDEFLRTKEMLLEISDFSELMENEPAGRASILAREEIVQPLLTIQQYALMQIQKMRASKTTDSKELDDLSTMVMRSLFGNINASRNSA